MALLRQCLQELRLRRGDMDFLFEPPQSLGAYCPIATPMRLRRKDDLAGNRLRSDQAATWLDRPLRELHV